MKKALFILLSVAVVAAFIYTDIASTAHDFSTASGTWNTGGEICQPCHTPHNGGIDGITNAVVPLWNHQVTAPGPFTPYTSPTFSQAPGTDPSGISLLCLSCHDGTIGLDAFGTTASSTNYITGTALLDTDLTNDHPISFTYDDAATADTEIITANATINGWLQGGAGGSMECSSCHDVHGVTGVSNLLRTTNAASALCLTCHDK